MRLDFVPAEMAKDESRNRSERARELRSATCRSFNNMDLEARGGIEPPIKVLQTFALPLGYRAV